MIVKRTIRFVEIRNSRAVFELCIEYSDGHDWKYDTSVPIGSSRSGWTLTGSPDKPTLRPSLDLDCSPEYKFHGYLTDGKLTKLKDSFGIEIKE